MDATSIILHSRNVHSEQFCQGGRLWQTVDKCRLEEIARKFRFTKWVVDTSCLDATFLIVTGDYDCLSYRTIIWSSVIAQKIFDIEKPDK